MKKDFIDMTSVKSILEYRFPRWNELPSIDLYIDQVINYIEDVFYAYRGNENLRILTKAMINNYVKQKVISAPVNKRYKREHLAYLIVICILKQIFSMSEIREIINIQVNSYSPNIAYDYFCEELENAIKIVFLNREDIMPIVYKKQTKETDMVRSMVLAVSNKVYVERLTEYIDNSINENA